MGDELTRDQVKRDDFLRDLASDPQKALRHWKRLKPGEDIVVIYYMTLTYGHTFAQHFKKEADRDKRPDLRYSVTNRADVTPETLTKQGFKFREWLVRPEVQERGWPSMSVWVHPAGKEIWLIQSAKAAPPTPVAAKPVHPDIEEMQTYVSQYAARKADMIRKAREIDARRSSLSQSQFEQARKEWWDDYKGWNDELDDIMDKVIPAMKDDDLTPDERKQKKTEIDKLKAMRKPESWPTDVLYWDPAT
jgi:hypothetical protein